MQLTESRKRYGAIVIYPSERIRGFGNLVAIARAEAQTVLKNKKYNIPIKDIVYSSCLNVWIAIFPIDNAPLPLYNRGDVTQNSCHKEEEKRRDK